MAYALVEWLCDGRVSVIPSSWVASPKPVPDNDTLPVPATVTWKKSKKLWQTNILVTSDSKQELNEISDGELPPFKGEQKQPLTKSEQKQSKRGENKKTKEARQATSDKASKTILERQPCENCELKLAEIELLKDDIKNKEEELQDLKVQNDNLVQDLKAQNDDLKSSLLAKRSIISDLEEQVKLKKPCYPTHSDFPSISIQSLKFLKSLATFYEDHPQDINSDESSDEEVSAYELKRQQNIERNKEELKRINEQFSEKWRMQEDGSLSLCASKTPVMTAAPGPVKSTGIKKHTSKYIYDVTPADLAKEQQAFQPGEGKRELVEGLGIYIRYIELEQCEQSSKNSPTGMMRALISVWYGRERLAACSATSGINSTIKTSIFKYCEMKYPNCSKDKLQRDLTSKCGEERRRITN